MPLTNPAFMYPVRFAASTYVLRVTADGTTEDRTFPASGSLDSETDYWMIGDGSATDLLSLFDLCLESHTQIDTATTTFTSDGYLQTVFTITAPPVTNTVQIHWSHANTTLNEAIFGYANADTSAALTLTGTLVPHGIVFPEQPPSEDSRERQGVVGGTSVSVSGLARTSRFTLPKETRDLFFDLLPQEKTRIEYAAADELTANFEYMWLNALSLGRRVRYAENSASLGTYSVYRQRPPLNDPMSRSERYKLRWSVDLRLVEAS